MRKYREDIESRFTARHRACIEYSGNVKGKTLLDIGCWIGWYEKFMVEKGCGFIVGIDIDRNAVQKAKKMLRFAQCDFVLASTLKLPFNFSSFDMVSLFDVLEHVPKNLEIKTLSRVNETLRANGTLLLSVPNNNPIAKFSDPAYFLASHRHYNLNELKKILEKSGFKTYKSVYGGGFVELFSMIFLYLFKHILDLEIPFKMLVESLRNKEYRGKGFATLFVKAVKMDYENCGLVS